MVFGMTIFTIPRYWLDEAIPNLIQWSWMYVGLEVPTIKSHALTHITPPHKQGEERRGGADHPLFSKLACLQILMYYYKVRLDSYCIQETTKIRDLCDYVISSSGKVKK